MNSFYVNAVFGFRDDSRQRWETLNPILKKGEPSIVNDDTEGKWLKIGDGVTPWSDLPYKVFPKGEDGYTPQKGVDYFDGKDGINGVDGINGKDGVSATHSWDGTTLTVTSASGTSSADLIGPRGHSGLVPKVTKPYSWLVIPAVNTETEIGELTGDISITILHVVSSDYSNEWIFTITQGDTAYDVALPEIEWQLGIAPTFSANTTTEVRLYYIGDTLKGVWN